MNEIWEVLIVGGGSAGLSAALMAGRACRKVLVIDAGEPRNRFAAHMHGVLGLDGLDPAELLRRGRDEVAAYDVTIRPGAVDRIDDADDGLTVTLTDGTVLSTRAVVVASGATDELPAIPGLAEQWGAGVMHCPYCHGWEVRNRPLAVVGVSPFSLHQAELIRQWTDDLTFFTADFGDLDPAAARRLRDRGVKLVSTPVTEILSDDGELTGVLLDDGTRVAVDGIFVAPVPRPNDAFLTGLGLERTTTPMGEFLKADPMGRTSHPRIWAAGNVVNPGANVPISIGAAAFAGAAVNAALVTEDFDRAAADTADDDPSSPAEYWENEYAGAQRRWSGRVNATTAAVVDALPGDPGTALDLGCGEGGDAVWLAERGWRVTAVDISQTAVTRGAEGAEQHGVADRIDWVAADLATWEPSSSFDLVTTSFLHSSIELPRADILRRAGERVNPGGHLLIVTHVFEGPEDVPPWAVRFHGAEAADDPDLQARLAEMLSPAEDLAALAFDDAEWETVAAEARPREAVGPDGEETAFVKDGVILLRRRAV
ncbi:MAG: bifunctional NAD(P)/FAD-dependent oxidoreductase/class I SAM-dependent methyltransferase [Gordonia sp. (in: high G+C Gram-positive bacteria)]|uniref:FAD-dependent oxidoreductase n=1 Tax=Gordonia sp. (in: high G+C Gram-positive bacteria) TaxID=84139 RepID=UPI0039E67ADB